MLTSPACGRGFDFIMPWVVRICLVDMVPRKALAYLDTLATVKDVRTHPQRQYGILADQIGGS